MAQNCNETEFTFLNKKRLSENEILNLLNFEEFPLLILDIERKKELDFIFEGEDNDNEENNVNNDEDDVRQENNIFNDKKLFHIKGNITEINLNKAAVQHNQQNFYITNLTLSDTFILNAESKEDEENETKVFEYHIKLINKNDLLFNKLSSLDKSAYVYFTNMKPKIEESTIVFYSIIGSKVFIKSNIYEIESIDWLSLENMKSIEIKSFKSNKSNKEKIKPTNKSIITTNVSENIPESKSIKILSLNEINILIEELQDNYITNFNQILSKKISNSIIGITSISSLNGITDIINIIGVISKVEFKDNFHTFEIISLVDSNSIKVYFYSKKSSSIKFDLFQKNSIIKIEECPVKLNKNLDIIIELTSQNNIEIIGLLKEDDFRGIKKFRKSENYKELDFLINLIQPVITRNIKKYYVQIRQIYNIKARIEENCSTLFGFENLKLTSKCCVDDGTFEALISFSDQNVIDIFDLDYKSLTKIHNDAKLALGDDISLYDNDKYGNSNNFQKYFDKSIYDVLRHQFYCYCIPFGFMKKKNINYSDYFEKLNDNKKLNEKEAKKDQEQNFIFVNGDISADKSKCLIPKIKLNVLHIEFLSDNNEIEILDDIIDNFVF